MEKLNCTDFCCGRSIVCGVGTALPETKIDPENGWLEVGSLVSVWECIISGAVSVLGSVNDILQRICFLVQMDASATT